MNRVGAAMFAITLLLRLFVIGFVWAVTYRILLFLSMSVNSNAAYSFSGMAELGVLVMVPGALLISFVIARLQITLSQNGIGISMMGGRASRSAESIRQKAKRGDSIGDMLAVLDEDDRYDVQQRIKQRLMDQIDGADAGEMDSFAELLGTPERQKRR